MEIVIKATQQDACKVGAQRVAQLLREKPNAVLGLATGSTPLGLYAELIRMHKDEGLDFRHVTTFNLDEYVGLGREHPASYNQFMHENFFSKVNVRKDKIHIPYGLAKDIPTFCREYENAIRDAGGIDMQILGIGSDGHIGFNEPSSSFASRTRIKTLTQKTVEDNKRFFKKGEEVPLHVITMGIGTIMEARCCLLLAFGAGKAEAVAQMAEGPLSAMVPASILQMHPRAVALLDEPSAAKLKLADYYRFTYDHKPNWQQWEGKGTKG